VYSIHIAILLRMKEFPKLSSSSPFFGTTQIRASSIVEKLRHGLWRNGFIFFSLFTRAVPIGNSVLLEMIDLSSLTL
jgi:hypothetical protein